MGEWVSLDEARRAVRSCAGQTLGRREGGREVGKEGPQPAVSSSKVSTGLIGRLS